MFVLANQMLANIWEIRDKAVVFLVRVSCFSMALIYHQHSKNQTFSVFDFVRNLPNLNNSEFILSSFSLIEEFSWLTWVWLKHLGTFTTSGWVHTKKNIFWVSLCPFPLFYMLIPTSRPALLYDTTATNQPGWCLVI